MQQGLQIGSRHNIATTCGEPEHRAWLCTVICRLTWNLGSVALHLPVEVEHIIYNSWLLDLRAVRECTRNRNKGTVDQLFVGFCRVELERVGLYRVELSK